MASFPTPTYTPGTLGNGVNAVSLAAGKTIACLIDSTLILGLKINCLMVTGSSPPTVATTFSLYPTIGQTAAAPATTLSAGPSSGATSISVVSATGIQKNGLIAIIPNGGGLGEVATVTAISGTTLTVAALTNGYSSGASVFLIGQTPTIPTAPGTAWAATTPYDNTLFPPANWLWVLGVKNGDATNTVTITVTYDESA